MAAIVSKVFDFLTAYPSFVIAVILLVLIITVLAKFVNGSKPGKNPFYVDTIRPTQPLVTDQAARDRVIKQGFVAKKVPDDLDAIVIGSGMGGMAVAALMAKTGKKVLVLEQHDQAGGCCHTYVDKGYEFDVGIHYVGHMNEGHIDRFYIDQLTNGQLQWARLDEPYDTVIIGETGKEKYFPIYSGKERYRQGLIDKFPNEVKAIDKFLERIDEYRKIDKAGAIVKMVPLWLVNLAISTGLINLITPYFKLALRTTQSVIEELTDDKDLQTVMAYNFGDYGVAPNQSSFAMHAGLVRHFWSGGYYPIGGASEIALQIIPTIEKAGGKVLVRAPVSQILLDKDGKASGVRVQKSSGDIDIHAPLIISGAGFFNTFNRLLPPQALGKAGFKPIIKDIQHGVGAMSLFVGLKGTKEELKLHARNYWAFKGNDLSGQTEDYIGLNAEEAMKSDVPLLFMSFPSCKDPTWEQRYPGKSTCVVITLANWEWFQKWESGRVMKRGKEYDDLKHAIADKMWEQACSLFPQLKDKVDYFEIGSPVSNKYYIAAPKGEIYGLDHNVKRTSAKVASALRPQTKIPNLYLTGQDILGCGFAGAAFGGLLCACSVLNRNVMGDLVKLQKKVAKNK
ncbi:all-trans-retinol 13,14-reductase-like [Glandiceps talaboti]